MLDISFGTRLSSTSSISGTNGYGYATIGMLNSLESLGYHVQENNASADVEIWFDQPQHWKFSPNIYKIGYLPWESTQLMPGWVDIMNKCDEIWTPSPLIANWFTRYAGVKSPVHVYEHGVDKIWKPVDREIEDTIKFLHVGGETRKGAWDSIVAFNRAFPNRKDVSLTIKTINSSWNRIPSLGRTKFMDEKLSEDQLVSLFQDHDVYSYPSSGEGFGLTPLQALAVGMPVVTVPNWAPYSKFLDERLNIKAEMKPSLWPKIHPGKMFRPDFDDFIDRLRFAADNFDSVKDFSLRNTDKIKEKYDWNYITKQVFSDLEERIKVIN